MSVPALPAGANRCLRLLWHSYQSAQILVETLGGRLGGGSGLLGALQAASRGEDEVQIRHPLLTFLLLSFTFSSPSPYGPPRTPLRHPLLTDD